eukprot:6482182-Amphidinium_carterae.1
MQVQFASSHIPDASDITESLADGLGGRKPINVVRNFDHQRRATPKLLTVKSPPCSSKQETSSGQHYE